MILEYGNAWSRIKDASAYEWGVLKRIARYRMKGYFWTRAYKQGKWDGWSSLLRKEAVGVWHVPSGFVPRIVAAEEFQGLEIVGAPRDPVTATGLDGVELTEYQRKAVRALLAHGRGILEAPPGSGKTEIILAAIKSIGLPALWVVPTLNLQKQTVERFAARIGKGCAGYKTGGRVIGESVWCHVAVENTLATGEFLERQGQVYKILCMDEVHRQGAKTFYDVSMAVDARWRFGCSATPFKRKDGRDILLEAAIGPVVASCPAGVVEEEGRIVPTTVRMLRHYTPHQEWGPVWGQVETQGIVHCGPRNEAIMDALAEYWGKEPVMILVRRIEHGRILREMIRARFGLGVPFVYGTHGAQARADAQAKLEEGRTPCLIASDIFGEGQDMPAVGVVIVAAGGKSEIRTVQRLGRAIRANDGKTRAIVYDLWDEHNGMLYRHVRKRLRQYEEFGAEIEHVGGDDDGNG